MTLSGAQKTISEKKDEAEIRFEVVKRLKTIREKLENIKSKL
jgi:hypothetical protein